MDSLNEPTCANIQFGSNATATGPWTVSPSLDSTSEYLTASLIEPNVSTDGVSVIFEPDIKQKGNYTVTIFTPGCQADNTCDTRGIVNVTGNYATVSAPGLPLQTQIYQTNDYDKYDQIYQGPVDVNSDGFRPTVTLAPLAGQKKSITIVAQRVQFNLTANSTGGLNGLYEFDPNSNTLDTSFSNSTFDQAGMDLEPGATVTTMAVVNNNVTFVGGNFTDTSTGFRNIFSIETGNSTSLPNGGLNAEVSSIVTYNNLLYIGGNFTNTLNGSVTGLNNIAAFDPTTNLWQALGAGVSGAVSNIVSLEVNVTTDKPETCITVNGFFDQLNGWDSYSPVNVSGFGIWVPSRQNWLQNLHLPSQAITGQLTAMTNVTKPNTTEFALLAGILSSEDMSSQDAVYLKSNPTTIQSLNVGIQPQPIGPVTRKRALSGQNVTGAVTGLFHAAGSLNVTVIGGHFTATASNGSIINNLVILNGTTVTGLSPGLDSDSSFLALAASDTVLYAGGTVTGNVNNAAVNGLVFYDLGLAAYSYPQPPAFGGENVAVNAITVRPNKSPAQVYVGGSFDTAGSLGCPSVCIFENGAWNPPGSGLTGSVNSLTWQGTDKLLAGGNLTVGNNATSLATYDTTKSQWTAVSGAAESVPGPVTALARATDDASSFWVAGQSKNDSAFLVKYDGNSNSYSPVAEGLGPQTTIQGLSVLPLTKGHTQNNLVPNNMVLLVTGQLNLTGFGNASAALFNGTTFTPFILATSGNSPGSLSQLFSENSVKLTSAGKCPASQFARSHSRLTTEKVVIWPLALSY